MKSLAQNNTALNGVARLQVGVLAPEPVTITLCYIPLLANLYMGFIPEAFIEHLLCAICSLWGIHL